MTNSNSLQMFSNGLFNIRIVMRDSKPWFVAKDVADCIGHKDTSSMVRMCRDKDVCVEIASRFDSATLAEYGNIRITLISESGLYRILGKSNLPKCEPFESWVFDEVLPSIRQNGYYAIAPKDSYLIDDPIERAKAWIAEQEEKKRIEQQRDEAIRTKALYQEGLASQMSGRVGGLQKANNSLRRENSDLKEQNEILKVSLGESNQWMSSAQLIQNFKLHRINGKDVKPRTLTTMLKKCGCRHRESEFPDAKGFKYAIFFVEDVKKALNIF